MTSGLLRIAKDGVKALVHLAGYELVPRRSVQLGLDEDEMIEALSGVAEGDRVIVAGQGGLDDGQSVKVL